jgi:hypothetical protein
MAVTYDEHWREVLPKSGHDMHKVLVTTIRISPTAWRYRLAVWLVLGFAGAATFALFGWPELWRHAVDVSWVYAFGPFGVVFMTVGAALCVLAAAAIMIQLTERVTIECTEHAFDIIRRRAGCVLSQKHIPLSNVAAIELGPVRPSMRPYFVVSVDWIGEWAGDHGDVACGVLVDTHSTVHWIARLVEGDEAQEIVGIMNRHREQYTMMAV